MSNDIECRTSSVVPRLYATPWNIALQAPLSMDRQSRILQWVAIPFSRRSSPGSILGIPLCEQTLYCLSRQGDSNHYVKKKKSDCQNRRAQFHPWVMKIVQFISSVLRDWLSYPSLTPRPCTNSCPPGQGCYLMVFPNVIPSYSHFQSFLAPEKSPRSPFIIMRTLLTKISPEYSLEELVQALKLQYFGHLM